MAMEKACRKCGEVKALGSFYRETKAPDGRKGICIACQEVRRLERIREKRPDFQPRRSFKDPPGKQICRKCERVLELTAFTRARERKSGRAIYCRECKHAAQKEYRKSEPYTQVKARTMRYKARLRSDIDSLRKVWATSPVKLASEGERLAYAQGFLSGRAVQEQESERVKESRDLVFRIASELHKGRPDVTFEDMVGYGYEGMLNGIRSYRTDRNTSFRTHVANKIRWGINDQLRRRGTSWKINARGKDWIGVSLGTSRQDDGSLVNPVDSGDLVPVEDAPVDDVTQAKLEEIEKLLSPRHAEIVRLRLEGHLNSEIGTKLGVTSSRITQLLGEIRQALPEDPGEAEEGDD